MLSGCSAPRVILERNRQAASLMTCDNDVAIVPGASHLFEESRTLTRAAHLARDWFGAHFDGPIVDG